MYERDNMKWRMFTDSIAKEILPFNTVKKKKQHLQVCCKQTYILSLYNKVKDDILKEIKDISFYSATTLWSSLNVILLYIWA